MLLAVQQKWPPGNIYDGSCPHILSSAWQWNLTFITFLTKFGQLLKFTVNTAKAVLTVQNLITKMHQIHPRSHMESHNLKMHCGPLHVRERTPPLGHLGMASGWHKVLFEQWLAKRRGDKSSQIAKEMIKWATLWDNARMLAMKRSQKSRNRGRSIFFKPSLVLASTLT